MEINRDTLSRTFGAEVSDFGPLPTGFGLRVDLAVLTDISRDFKVEEFQHVPLYSYPDLSELVNQAGVLIVENAKISARPNSLTTGNPSLGGLGKQDLFHWHSPRDGTQEPRVAVLYKPETEADREQPTLFTRLTALRKALGEIDLEVFNLKDDAKAGAAYILNKMRRGYTFSLAPEERAERTFVNDNLPGLMAHLVKIIPAHDLFAARWEKGKNRVVLLSNKRSSGLVHGRAHGEDARDPLSSLVLEPP